MLLPFPPRFIAAHRGCTGVGACENTLASFERAIALGADAIELDVRRVADGDLVVFHDAEVNGRRLDRLTRRELDRLVPDRNVPSLDEVARALAGRIRLDVEIKDQGLEASTLDAMRRSGWPATDFAVT